MAAKKQHVPVATTSGHKAAIVKLINSLQGRHQLWQVFSDFVEMAACSIANACDRSNRDWQAREDRYMQIVKGYSHDELQLFPQMLGHLVEAFEAGPDDVLGEVFMELDLGSKWHGQFFTPYELCQMMAACSMGSPEAMRAHVEEHGFVRVSEPACGGGAMLVAFAEEMRNRGLNYQRHMHAVAQDLDLKAVHMAYIQLSLMHIPAVVVHGNTLALEERSRWLTPAHVMGGWTWRLQRQNQKTEVQPEPAAATEPIPASIPSYEISSAKPSSQWEQGGLF